MTTFFLDHDIDTGRIIMQLPFDIPDDADVEYVYDGLMHLGADICLQTLERIITADGYPETVAQDDSSLHPAPKIFKETCEIDWSKTAKQVYDFIRGLSPYPGAWTTWSPPTGKKPYLRSSRLRKTGKPTTAGKGSITVEGKSLLVAAGDEWLSMEELQLAGKKRMPVRDFLNGMKDMDIYYIK